ncbi:MAG: oxidoreductase [Actinobacteria bacterium HGW-Actinobacteria-4]|nr:MAG: oxidoreductase [Actinobacteria bacterium HGW-Actinobacteria-4]
MADKHVQWQDATVLEREDVADGIVRIVLEPAQPVAPQPGAHIDVLVNLSAGRDDTRSYSIAGASRDGRRLAISVSRRPDSRGGSEYMHARQPGDRLRITQPLQDFPLRIGAPSYVLVAGGVGITAIRGMASTLKRLGAEYTLHYVGNSRSRMAYLENLEATHGDCLASHITTEDGRMDVDELLATVPRDAELYMCGPIRLMEAIRRIWERDGRDITALRYETFGNSGWFDAEPFRVEVPRLGVTVQVKPGESMLEALESAGVDMMSDCRRGECGLCEVDILHLDGRVDHRDVFYSERQKAPNSKMCCCVSRVVAGPNPDAGPGRVSIEVT